MTAADVEADRFLRDRLLRESPGYGWVSEEGGEGRWADRTWVVDPLDGTANFIAGVPEFAVCIGLVERGTAVLGVVYNPVTGTLYHGVADGGAFRDGAPIAARGTSVERPRLVVSANELKAGRLEGVGEVGPIETLGATALKICRVAEGGADLYISRTRKGPWDVCAAAVIAHEAGVEVFDGAGRPIAFGPDAGETEGLIAAATGAAEHVPRVLKFSIRGREEDTR